MNEIAAIAAFVNGRDKTEQAIFALRLALPTYDAALASGEGREEARHAVFHHYPGTFDRPAIDDALDAYDPTGKAGGSGSRGRNESVIVVATKRLNSVGYVQTLSGHGVLHNGESMTSAERCKQLAAALRKRKLWSDASAMDHLALCMKLMNRALAAPPDSSERVSGLSLAGVMERATLRALGVKTDDVPGVPGDRWRHELWPDGTPDAVIGTVVDGCITWAERGGAKSFNILARHLTSRFGWRLVGRSDARTDR